MAHVMLASPLLQETARAQSVKEAAYMQRPTPIWKAKTHGIPWFVSIAINSDFISCCMMLYDFYMIL